MPAAVAVPAIASVVGGGISYLGSRSANKAQEKASNQAIAFEREREAERKKNYQAAMGQYEARTRYQDALRSALLGRLGFDTSGIGMTPPIAQTPMGGPPGGAVPRRPMGPQMALPMGPAGAPPPPQQGPMQGQSIRELIRPGELSAWNDWEARGLR